MKRTITTQTARVPRENHRWVSVPHEIHQERLRQRAGAAYARIKASGDEIAAALGRHHSTVTHRKAGQGPLAHLLIEIDALVRNGHDIAPLMEAIYQTKLEAAGGEVLCPRALAKAEQDADAAEDVAGTAYLAGAGTAEEWARSILAHLVHAKRMLRALRGVS